MLQQLQMLGKLDPAERAGEADGEEHGVGAQPAPPGERRGDRDVGEVSREVHYIVAPMVHGANSSSP